MIEKEVVIDMRMLIDDIRKKVNNNQRVILKGEGVSMVPFITDADLLTLIKPKNKRAKVGEIYLYKREDGSYAIHRVYAVKNDWVFMLGDAQLFIEKVPKSCLVAIVSTVKKPHKRIDCLNGFVRTAGAIRMKTRIFKHKSYWRVRTLFCRVLRLLGKIKKLVGKDNYV